jgi:RNA polymerase sigma-70 factor (ECF subfamily)
MAAAADERATVATRVDDETDGFLALVEGHSRNMYQLAFRMTGDEQDAKDIVQESLFRAYQHLGGFEGRSNVGTWLHRIVVNAALDLLRARRTRPDRAAAEPIDRLADHIASASPDPERLAASTETARRIAGALDTLNPVERAAFSLRHFEDYSIDEIAAALDLRTNNVKQHIFRAVRKLRRALEPEGERR